MSILHPDKIVIAAALSLSLALAGCDSSDMLDKVSDSMSNFNPFGANKKKLPGDRHEVFPEGVPGVQQGVPPDMMVGAKRPADQTATIAAEPKPEPKPKVAKHHTPKPRKEARQQPPQQPVAPQSARRADPAWTAAPTAAPAGAPARQPAGDAAWGGVPAAGAQAPRPAPQATAPQAARPPQQGGGAAWNSPSSQPVPTIWPDPK